MTTTKLPPEIWQCHGYTLARYARCPECGRQQTVREAAGTVSCDFRGIDSIPKVQTRVDSKNARKCHSSALNKTEHRFAAWVMTWPNPPVLVVPHPLPGIPLTDGQTYRPDFLLIWDGGVYQYAEIKGGHAGKHIAWSERGIEKYKRARAEHPMVRFGLYRWNGKQWERK